MILEYVYDYLSDVAPVLFFKLDAEGLVLSMNRYARQVCGELSPGMKFQDLIIDFKSIFDLKSLSDANSGEQMFSINTLSGYPQTYLFMFKTVGREILAFGHLDINDINMMRTEFLSLNQELGNLSRQLHKKNAELQYALDNIKTLSGLLPICSFCKKIRDDKGYWNQLEAYIHKHSEAEFSHSICRDCAKEHYPDMDIYDD